MNIYHLSKEECDRIKIVKLIAIILVVYIHSYSLEINYKDGTANLTVPIWLLYFEDLISQKIARCAVPTFFLISSILLFKTRRLYWNTIKHKVCTLVVPYLIWNSFWILIFLVLQNLSITAPFFSGSNTPILQSSLGEWLELYGIGIHWPYPQDYPLWFIRDVFIITLFFPIITYVADKIPTLLLSVLIAALFIPITFPLKESILWFCIGACIVKLQIHLTALDKFSTMTFTLFYIVCAFGDIILQSTVTNTLLILSGILFLIRISKSIYNSQKAKEIFLGLSEWTFIIYATHEMTLSSLKKICIKILPTTSIWLLIEYIFIPVIVIWGCCIAGKIFKRFAPKLYAISTGAR